MKLINKLLADAPLFKDTVLAISNMTKTVNDLVKAYTALAKMVIEDREALNELYNLHSEMLIDKQLREETKKHPIIDVSFSHDSDKKKMVN